MRKIKMPKPWIFVVFVLTIFSRAAAAEPTGVALPGMTPFIVQKWDIPGASLAVAKDGRLLLARGYGYANKDREEPVQPTHLFRFGSLTKTVTSVAILKLVEDGRLKLDDKVLPILGELGPPPDRIGDARVKDITVRNLLQHSGGWDRDKSGDPIEPRYAKTAAARVGMALPPTCLLLMHDALEYSLDFPPGERYAYSNIGYCILGRVIEKVSGMTYEAFVRQHIFDQIPVRALQWGQSLETAPNEVHYYDYPGAPEITGMPGLVDRPIAAPYGYFYLEGMDAFGSLIGTPVDYLKFLLAIDGRYGPALLNRASIRAMQERPAYAKTANSYYGLGVMVRP